MSVSYTSYSGLGVLVHLSFAPFWAAADRPSCNHRTRHGHRFCPSCGKRVENTADPEAVALKERFEAMVDRPLGDGYVAGQIGDADSDCYFIGYGHKLRTSQQDYSSSNLDVPTMDEIKSRLKELLEPFGLYDERQFGFHSGLYYSY